MTVRLWQRQLGAPFAQTTLLGRRASEASGKELLVGNLQLALDLVVHKSAPTSLASREAPTLSCIFAGSARSYFRQLASLGS